MCCIEMSFTMTRSQPYLVIMGIWEGVTMPKYDLPSFVIATYSGLYLLMLVGKLSDGHFAIHSRRLCDVDIAEAQVAEHRPRVQGVSVSIATSIVIFLAT
jgi:hypothetical protein